MKRFKKESGFSLLEAVVAVAFLTLILGALAQWFAEARRQQRVTSVTGAVAQYEDLFRTLLLSRIRHFVEAMALGQAAPLECNSTFTFNPAHHASEDDLAHCFTFTLPAGLKFALIRSSGSTSSIPVFPAAAGAAQSSLLPYQKYIDCQNNLSIHGGNSNHGGDTSLRFCLLLTASSTNTPGFEDLRSMQPFFADITYFNYFMTPTQPPAGSGYVYPTGASAPTAPPTYASPALMTIRELGKLYNGLGTLAAPYPPVMNYINYTMYWTSPSGPNSYVYKRHSGFFAQGNGNG